PAGARLGEGPVYRGVGGAHLQRPAMASTDRVRNGRKIEKSLARAARRTEPPCPHRVPVTRTQSGASNRKAVRSDQRREITGPQNGSTATRSGIRSQALSSPAAAARAPSPGPRARRSARCRRRTSGSPRWSSRWYQPALLMMAVARQVVPAGEKARAARREPGTLLRAAREVRRAGQEPAELRLPPEERAHVEAARRGAVEEVEERAAGTGQHEVALDEGHRHPLACPRRPD